MKMLSYRALGVVTFAVLMAAASPLFAQASGETLQAPEAPEWGASSSDDEGGARARDEGEDTERFDLEELTKRTLANEALLREMESREAAASWDEFRADHAWTPKLSSRTLAAPVPANAEPDRFGENLDEVANLEIGPYVRQDFDLALPLYTFGRIKTAQNLADLGVDRAEIENEIAQLEVLYEIKRAYYGLRLATTFDEMLAEGEEILEDQLADMQEARDFGEADFDTEDFRKLEIFDAEVDSLAVENERAATMADSGIRFLADLGEETDVKVPELEEAEDTPELRDRDRYLAYALEHRPEARQLDLAVEARRLEHDLEKSKWYPEVFLGLSLGLGWSTEETALQEVCRIDDSSGECVDDEGLFARPYADPLNRLSVQAGVGLRWNIDPFQRYGQVEKKEAQTEMITAQRSRAHGAIDLEVTRLYEDAADKREQLDIKRRKLKAAERWRDQFGLSEQTAGADVKDAVDPLKAYYEARAEYLEAIYNYMVARAALAQGVGATEIDESGEPRRTDWAQP
ncbi:MAG: TolC family protein [Persicimonas sp.]